MRCPNCGVANPPGSKFCARVRQSVCSSPSCGSRVLPAAKFCNECGTALTLVGTTDTCRHCLAGALRHPRLQRPQLPSAACARFCSSTLSASHPSRRNATPRRQESCSRTTSSAPRPSSPITGARSRSSSAMPSWLSGGHRSPTRTTPSAPSGPPWTSWSRLPISAPSPAWSSWHGRGW